MRCTNCGNEIKPGTSFCNSCGMKVNNQGQAINEDAAVYRTEYPTTYETEYTPVFDTTPSYSREVVKKKTGIGSILLIISLVIAIILCVVVLCYAFYNFGATNSASETEVESSVEETEENKQDIEGETTEELNEEEVPVEEESTESNPSYFFPSDRVYITESDLYGKTKSEVAFMRNEIYARHGYIFKTEPYKTYFPQQDWYEPNPYFNENSFNTVEKANKNFLVKYEQYMGWR